MLEALMEFLPLSVPLMASGTVPVMQEYDVYPTDREPQFNFRSMIGVGFI